MERRLFWNRVEKAGPPGSFQDESRFSVSSGWIEFVVFTVLYDANITMRVDCEFLWGRQIDHTAVSKSGGLFYLLGR